jgi:hypothetical protein
MNFQAADPKTKCHKGNTAAIVQAFEVKDWALESKAIR